MQLVGQVFELVEVVEPRRRRDVSGLNDRANAERLPDVPLHDRSSCWRPIAMPGGVLEAPEYEEMATGAFCGRRVLSLAPKQQVARHAERVDARRTPFVTVAMSFSSGIDSRCSP